MRQDLINQPPHCIDWNGKADSTEGAPAAWIKDAQVDAYHCASAVEQNTARVACRHKFGS
jgi:hypothetical protein